MFMVGLTGGIGSGKSTIANLFSEYGISIIDTDLISHQIIQPDGPAYQTVIDHFGQDILSADNTINRKRLGEIVFSSDKQKKILESILHPLIWVIVKQQVSDSKSPYCIIVVPLLFEGQHQNRFSSILVVDIPVEEQIKRVLNRDNRTRDEVMNIINKQTSRSERLELADEVINNIEAVNILGSKIKILHEKYLSQAENLTQ